MTRRTYLSGIAAVCAAILVSAGLLAQEEGYEEMSPEQAAMMEAWMKWMTPGEAHENLARRAGKWTYTGKAWHSPDSEPIEFEGQADVKLIMGGRFLLETVEGPFQGETFNGLGIFGFDNITQTYVGAWVDNMGTGILRYEGTPSGDGKTIHWTGMEPDFMNNTYKKGHSTDTIVDEDHLRHVWYSTTPDGLEYKHMELEYERGS